MASPLPGYASHFGIDNLPFGVASSAAHRFPTCVSRLEDTVIFLADLNGAFKDVEGLPDAVFRQRYLNDYATLPDSVHQKVRYQLRATIRAGLPESSTEHISAVTMLLPVSIGDFTDFSCSLDHVLNASEAATGTRAAPPSFFHQPVGYAGRCSSLSISGTAVQRPLGQYWEGKPRQSDVVFGPSRKMDYELEIGCIVGRPISRNQPIMADQAEQHIFGYVLVNDWSARDIQVLEMDPLGPLNGKNAGTTLSPWIITRLALEDCKTASPPRQRHVAPHLSYSGHDTLSIDLTASISKSTDGTSEITCRSNTSSLYWTLAQCLAHQAIGGAGLRTGDLVATGTVSGSTEQEHGCLFEYVQDQSAAPRGYLEDGEIATLSGRCTEGIGFGECVATLIPATSLDV